MKAVNNTIDNLQSTQIGQFSEELYGLDKRYKKNDDINSSNTNNLPLLGNNDDDNNDENDDNDYYNVGSSKPVEKCAVCKKYSRRSTTTVDDKYSGCSIRADLGTKGFGFGRSINQ